MLSRDKSPPLYRPDPTFKEPFTIDTIFRLLDHIPFSPPFLIIIPAIVAIYSQKVHNTSLVPSEPSWAALRHVISTFKAEYKIFFYIVAFIAVKSVNRTLSRIAHNNGHYRGAVMDWDKEIAVVTGGSNGIGKEIAVLLAEKTKRPVAVLDLAPMSYTHPNVRYYKADVGNEAEFASVAAKIRADIGEPSIVVNNAGVTIGRKIIDTPADAMSRVIKVNTFAHMYSARLFLPHMVKINHGHVVTIASSASYMTLPNLSTYAMSKAATLAFHEALKAELRARYRATNVRTTIVCPTKVATMLGANLANHPNPFFTPTLSPETVARRVVRSVESGLSEDIMMPAFTKILPIMRGAPSWLRRLVEIAGHTDQGVTDDSDAKALKSGYAYYLGQLIPPDRK